jgi:hypothetical protein
MNVTVSFDRKVLYCIASQLSLKGIDWLVPQFGP